MNLVAPWVRALEEEISNHRPPGVFGRRGSVAVALLHPSGCRRLAVCLRLSPLRPGSLWSADPRLISLVPTGPNTPVNSLVWCEWAVQRRQEGGGRPSPSSCLVLPDP